MAELPAELQRRVAEFVTHGEELADAEDYGGALARFSSAWALLPEPRSEWDDSLNLLAAIGDMQFIMGDYLSARQSFMDALKEFGGSAGNPFVRLRLGQAMFELGEHHEAASWLAGAYLLEGLAIFEAEDPKYLEFVKPQLAPPEGGWPDGW